MNADIKPYNYYFDNGYNYDCEQKIYPYTVGNHTWYVIKRKKAKCKKCGLILIYSFISNDHYQYEHWFAEKKEYRDRIITCEEYSMQEALE